MKPAEPATADGYLAAIPSDDFRRLLTRIREIIREEAPEAEEGMSYGMPGYKLNGPLVYFAAFKNHCSLFGARSLDDFADQLKGYKTSKGTIRFTPENPLPESLVREIVRKRLAENRAKKRR